MNVFVLSTGRCGSTTFARACSHISNFSSAHESQRHKIGEERLTYPENHIEVDNRLSWLLGRLDQKYGNDAFYVHLRRNPHEVARSFSRRWGGGIIRAYAEDVLLPSRSGPAPLEVSHDYVETVDRNIELFLRDKSQKLEVRLESIEEEFKVFWDSIGAVGDLDAAIKEFTVKQNASGDDGAKRAPAKGRAAKCRPRLPSKARLLAVGSLVIAGGAFAILEVFGFGRWGLLVFMGIVAANLVALVNIRYRKLARRLDEVGHRLRHRLRGEIADHSRRSVVAAHAAAMLHSRFPTAVIPLSSWSMDPAGLACVLDVVADANPGTVVELGSGVSTLMMGAFLKEKQGGRIISIEHDQQWADLCGRWIGEAGLDGVCEVRHVPLAPQYINGAHVEWYELGGAVGDIHDIGVLLVDGPPADRSGPMNREPALDVFLPNLANDAVVILDDADRSGETCVVESWRQRHPEFTLEHYSTYHGLYVMRRKTQLAAVHDEPVNIG